jgi:hypothetical protein
VAARGACGHGLGGISGVTGRARVSGPAGRGNSKNSDISDAQVVWTAQWFKTVESKFFGGPTKKTAEISLSFSGV